MKKLLIASLAAGWLTGCAGHNLTLMERGGRGGGTGHAPTTWGDSGDLTVNLNGKTYAGQWVMARGGSYGLMQAYGAGTVATGTAFGIEAGGVGNALLRASDGSGLRCEFRYSEMGGTGIGVCQDDAMTLYDLQIN